MNKCIYTDTLYTSRYKILYKIELASRLTDYDYSSDPGQRFPSTYIHIVSVLDRISESQLISFKFPSTTCASIIYSLYGMAIPREEDEFYSEDKVCMSSNNMSLSEYIIGFWSDCDDEKPQYQIVIGTQDGSDDIILSFTDDEIVSLINLLESDEIQNMCGIPSDNWWIRR